MHAVAERRAARRLPIEVRAEVSSEGQTIVSRHTRDLSTRGMFVKTSEVLGQGRACRVVLEPHRSGAGHAPIRVEGRIARIERTGLAVEFTEITMPSYVELQQLLSESPGRRPVATD